ncbi:hypothetical protein M0R72_02610 [Candidatus Pacearchaeota archaeon]|jgi:hypothetical protein|nr:hypothetical protein [Candidatus Pacearchaeota archaeon]
MRISFDDGGYLELQRSKKAQHVHVMVAARKPDNHLELLVNSAEIPLVKLIEAVKSVSGPIVTQQGRQNEDIENNNSGSSEEDHQ